MPALATAFTATAVAVTAAAAAVAAAAAAVAAAAAAAAADVVTASGYLHCRLSTIAVYRHADVWSGRTGDFAMRNDER